MKEIKVSLADLKKGIKLETGEDYTVVVLGARVHRLEIEDAFFQTASAVFLPDAPLAEQANPGNTDGAAFSNSELWDSLRKSHPGFADTLEKEPFDPDEDGGAAARARVSGADRLATVLRFLHDNQDHQLLIAGHTDRAGGTDYNQKLSEARAKSALAILAGDRDSFVEVCKGYHVADDDAVFVRYANRKRGWPCDLDDDKQASAAEIKQFQKSYNQEFDAEIAVDGVVGEETLGAYYDLLDDDLAVAVGGDDKLEELRGDLRFVSDDCQTIGFGEKYPVDPSEPDGTRCQNDRRVEMLLFATPDLPDLTDPDQAGKEIYVSKHYRVMVLTPGAVEADGEDGGATNEDFQMADAEAPEPGVGEPEEELATTMDFVDSARDLEDQWAFLDPLDEARTRQGDGPSEPDPDGTAIA
jgi:hypothetical protein